MDIYIYIYTYIYISLYKYRSLPVLQHVESQLISAHQVFMSTPVHTQRERKRERQDRHSVTIHRHSQTRECIYIYTNMYTV